MRIRITLATLVAFIMVFGSIGSVSAVTPKTGSTCAKVGKSQVYAGKKYTCVKKGNKAVWSAGKAIKKKPATQPTSDAPPKPRLTNIDQARPVAGQACSETSFGLGYSADFTHYEFLACRASATGLRQYASMSDSELGNRGYLLDRASGALTTIKPNVDQANFKWSDVCEFDPWIQTKYLERQLAALLSYDCYQTTRFFKKTLDGQKPTTPSKSIGNSPMSTCKLSNGPKSNARRGSDSSPPLLQANSKVHVIGVQAPDSRSSGNPRDDHKEYFDDIFEVFQNISDLPWNPQLIFSNEYLMMPKPFADYKVGRTSTNYYTKEREDFLKEVFAIAGNLMDLSNGSVYFVVTPPNTPSTLVANANDNFPISIGSRPRTHVSILHNWKMSWDPGTTLRFPTGPVHGLFHLGFSILDHYGDQYATNAIRNKYGSFTLDGTGQWGNMSGALMDWLAWDKWVARLISDQQIICSAGNETYWLKPSTMSGSYEKLIVIPTGRYTAIAIESMRNYGYNMKVPERHNGVLVYTINTDESRHGYGVQVQRPPYRTKPVNQFDLGDFGLSDATLKVNEKIEVNGFEIEVVEAGPYGDVVKILKR